MSGEDAIKLVLASKDEGNTHYKAKEYKEAIAAYSKGVKGLPDLDDEDEEYEDDDDIIGDDEPPSRQSAGMKPAEEEEITSV